MQSQVIQMLRYGNIYVKNLSSTVHSTVWQFHFRFNFEFEKSYWNDCEWKSVLCINYI